MARLVVDRRTNAEIAAALFLSQKTVETHVRNLFHKLGVSSQAEIARAVERADRGGAAPWLIADAGVIVAGRPLIFGPLSDRDGRKLILAAAGPT
ncbi:MAG TPA: helix-turn-helix transcriptional regulator [Propionibacteriaceae bacterium]|nr:helix-turn-helix transcriptional regulator [Propionibacteriaceae bacterium]